MTREVFDTNVRGNDKCVVFHGGPIYIGQYVEEKYCYSSNIIKPYLYCTIDEVKVIN